MKKQIPFMPIELILKDKDPVIFANEEIMSEFLEMYEVALGAASDPPVDKVTLVADDDYEAYEVRIIHDPVDAFEEVL